MVARIVFALAASVLALPGASAAEGAPPNVLLLVADDLGVTDVPCYGEGSDLPNTPHLDQLSQGGVRFRNAWSNPLCSPTRAAILTGRHPFRTGVGFVVQPQNAALPLSEWTLPEAIHAGTGGGYAQAAFGKWHLGNASVGGDLSPNLAGFPHFAGNMFSLNDDGSTYSSWTKVVDGVATPTTKYNTTDIVDDAIGFIQGAGGPWFCYVAFNAPHAPFHAPPANLHSVDLTTVFPPALQPRPYYKAMVEAMDAEIGRLLAALGPQAAETVVLFVGDNGTPAEVLAPPLPSDHGKPSLYEAGVRVPLLARGPGIAAGGVCDALVQTTDLFATVAALAGVDVQVAKTPGLVLDAANLVPLLADPTLPSPRDASYSEIFAPNGLGTPAYFGVALREQQYKMVVTSVAESPFGTLALFDLQNDPLESQNLLLGPLAPQAEAAFQDLQATLTALRGDLGGGAGGTTPDLRALSIAGPKKVKKGATVSVVVDVDTGGFAGSYLLEVRLAKVGAEKADGPLVATLDAAGDGPRLVEFTLSSVPKGKFRWVARVVPAEGETAVADNTVTGNKVKVKKSKKN